MTSRCEVAWARVDDGFHDHPKVMLLLGEPDGLAAAGLWLMCLTWAHRHTRQQGKRHGFIPAALPARIAGTDNKQLAYLLVSVGLWEEVQDGWVIHDFHVYLPSDELREKRAAAGRKGGQASRGGGRPPKTETSNLLQKNKQTPGRVKVVVKDEGSTSVQVKDVAPPRRDVERLCGQLADRIEANGSKRPTITQTWLDAARLLLDKDGRTEEQVTKAIDWCQADEFWRGNILSMPTLRKQYDRLRLAATRNGHHTTTKSKVQGVLSLLNGDERDP
jgi:hypothetical protein